jgi:hypothetical protein
VIEAERRTQTTASGRLAVAVLEWLDGANHLTPESDLCLVHDVANLDDEPLPPIVEMSGKRRWRVAHVDGDLGLRVALVDAEGMPLIAFTSTSEEAFGADLRERAVLRYAIRPLARHIFSALVDAEASALDDDRFLTPLTEILASSRKPRFLRAIAGRTWGRVMRDADATAVLCEAAFGFDDRYTETKAGDLWASWLIDPPLTTPSLARLARDVLRVRYPQYAALLDSVPDGSPRSAFERVAHYDARADEFALRLARDTARTLRTTSPATLDDLLADAEAAYARAGSPLVDAWLLRGAFAAHARSLAIRARSETPPTTADIFALDAYLFENAQVRDELIRLARLRRGLLAIEAATSPEDLDAFVKRFLTEIAWLDRAARRVREIHFSDAETAAVAAELQARWYATRDRLNEAFARTLARAWDGLFAKPGEGTPYVVSHVLKHFVRPMLAAKRKVFLIVLDGCDVPTFLEIVDAFSRSCGAPKIDAALSAIPTVTSHARRAIFFGEIPKEPVPEDDDASDPKTDRKAFMVDNKFLVGFEQELYLKGELADGGDALEARLKEPTGAPELIAAVFNDVDDAIGSKEHGVLPERTLERCTPAFRKALIAAFDNDWHVIVTADHGHTPYRAPDLKLSIERTRYAPLGDKSETPVGTIAFEKSAFIPYRLAAAFQMGAHAGPQHIGYHGGVSLEEMIVPLAVYDRSMKPDAYAPLLPPAWWDGEAISEQPVRMVAEARRPAVVPPATIAAAPAPVLQDDADAAYIERARALLGTRTHLVEIFDRVRTGAWLSAEQLAQYVGVPPGRLRPIVTGLNAHLENAGLARAIDVEDDPVVYRWVGTR